MKQNLKKLFALLLTISMVAGMLSTVSFAEGEGGDPGTDPGVQEFDPYIYKYDRSHFADVANFSYSARSGRSDIPTGWDPAEHSVSDASELDNSVWYDRFDVTRHHSVRMFGLDRTDGKTEEVAPVGYCVDFVYSVVDQHLYKRMNLEDSTYYSDDAAEYIRGVFQNGYWVDWTDADVQAAEDAANEWLDTVIQEEEVDPETQEVIQPEVRNKDKTPWNPPSRTKVPYPGDAEDAVGLIENLTAQEAQIATQMAIWGLSYVNGGVNTYWVDFVKSGAAKTYTGYSYIPDGTSGYELSEFSNNIQAFRKFLLHQQAEPMNRDDIVFSNDYFVTNSAVFTTGNLDGLTYDVSLRFKLAGEIMEEDALTVTATLGSKSETITLGGENGAEADANGYYTINFKSVSAEEAELGEIALSLTGEQYVEGVYFYQAKPTNGSARTSSQNLVGKAKGTTPVSAEATFTFDVGSKDATLTKYDGDTVVSAESSNAIQIGGVEGEWHPLLPGAVFGLYAKIDGEYVLVQGDLVTDANGRITVTGLADGYNYYFKEIAAPDGYVCEDSYHKIQWPDGTVTVENCFDVADLKLSKTVEGVPTDEHFTFTVTLDLSTADLANAESLITPAFEADWGRANCTISGEGEDAEPIALHPDTIAFVQEGEILTADVVLKDGETLTIQGIPTGTSYTVTEAANSYTPAGGATQSGTVGEDAEEAAFCNVKYNYENDNVEILVKKTVDGEAPGEQTFTFELSRWDGEDWAYVGSARNDANGDVDFKLTYTAPGEGIYRIQEVNDGGAYVYDNSTFYAKVSVTSRRGDLSASVKYYEQFENGAVKGSFSAEPPVFDNKAFKDGSLYLNGVKYLDNELSETAFTFELYDVTAGRTKLDTTQSGAGGVFQFEEITFTEPGTYTYEVKEKAVSGYNCDATVYTVTVDVVREDNGGMTVGAPVFTVPNPEPAPEDGSDDQDAIPVNGLIFHNTTKRSSSTPDDAQWQLTGSKTLDGAPAGGFTFQMVNEAGKATTVTSKGDGAISFPKQTFDKKGTYTYTITEMAGEDETIVYDPAVYTVTVTVEKVKGDYEVTGVTIAKDGVAVEAVAFENTTSTTEIPEDPTPTGDKPGDKEGGKDNDEEIFDEDIPLADAPATGDISALWLALSAISGTGLVLCRKKRED